MQQQQEVMAVVREDRGVEGGPRWCREEEEGSPSRRLQAGQGVYNVGARVGKGWVKGPEGEWIGARRGGGSQEKADVGRGKNAR